MNNSDDDGPRQFTFREHNLICRPSRLLAVQLLLNKWEKPLCIKKHPTVSVTLNWNAFKDAVKEQPYLWLLLLALGVISHQNRGNFEIRMKNDEALVIQREGQNHRIYFVSEVHARLCLAIVFAHEFDRKIYQYDSGGEVVSKEVVW